MAQREAPEYTWRIAATKEDAVTVSRFLRDEFLPQLQARGSDIDPAHAVNEVWLSIKAQSCIMLHHRDALAGVLMCGEAQWWWNGEPFLDEQAFAFAKKHRNTVALRHMLRAAQALASLHGMPLRLTIRTEARDQTRSGLFRIGEMFTMTPLGASTMIEPNK